MSRTSITAESAARFEARGSKLLGAVLGVAALGLAIAWSLLFLMGSAWLIPCSAVLVFSVMGSAHQYAKSDRMIQLAETHRIIRVMTADYKRTSN